MVIAQDLREERAALPWVEKYRPCCLEEVVSHGGTISTLRKFLAEGKLPHLFFYGPPGTGKTSMANALAGHLHGSQWRSSGNVLELNASDDRGIDVVREQIKTFASSGVFVQNTSANPKLVILDEADAMTSAAQNALRRIIEKYVQRVRFMLIGNYAGQIIPALQSRCTKFRFVPLDVASMREKLEHVIAQEHLNVSQEAREALLALAEGDMRKVLNWLQSAASSKSSSEAIVAKDIYAVSAAPEPEDLEEFWKTACQEDIGDAFGKLRALQVSKGIANADLIRYFTRRLMECGSPASLVFALPELAQVERRVSSGSNDSTQLASILGIVTIGIKAIAATGK